MNKIRKSVNLGDLDGDFLLCLFVYAQNDFSEPSLSQMPHYFVVRIIGVDIKVFSFAHVKHFFVGQKRDVFFVDLHPCV